MKLSMRVVVSPLLVLMGLGPAVAADTGALPLVVNTQVVAFAEYKPQLKVTGDVEARYHSDLAFRVSGRVSERLVDVGDHVKKGQVLAKLEPTEKQADLEAVEANVVAMEATLRQASQTLQRQKALLAKGFTTLSEHDTAEENFRVAQGNLEAAKAQVSDAQQNLDDTVLLAEEDGVITERQVEVGQVVQPGSKVFSIARDGPRDAVLKVSTALFANPLDDSAFRVQLVSDPQVQASATLREIAPTIDPDTGTVRIKLAIQSPPEAMTLGAPVSVIANMTGQSLVILPWSALASVDGKPAVWVVDPQSSAVTLRPVEVARHETERVLISKGLNDGEIVVTVGSQLLSPNQVVETREGAAL